MWQPLPSRRGPLNNKGLLCARWRLSVSARVHGVHSAAEPQPNKEGVSIPVRWVGYPKTTHPRRNRNAMQEFTAKHRDEIRGVLSGFDRLVFTERYLDALAEVDDDTTLGRAHPAPGTASAGDATSPSPLSLG